MNLAFQTTWEDIKVVMAQNGKNVTNLEAETIFETHISDELDSIERAALQGDDLEEQTEYAQQEITKILQEKEIL